MNPASSVIVRMGSENAAWVDDWRGEAVRLLRSVADAIEADRLSPGGSMRLMDSNGNRLGEAIVSK